MADFYDSDSSEDSHDQSDEELVEEEFERYTGVMGYQYEPKRKEKKGIPDGNQPNASEIPTATGSGHVDRPNRVGNTDWFVIFTKLFFSKWI